MAYCKSLKYIFLRPGKLFSLTKSSDAPQIFSLVGAGQDNLLLTGFFGVVKVVACLFFLLFLVERVGRRGSLLVGAFLMGTYMLIVAVLTAKFPPDPDAGLTAPSIASLTMIYLEAMSYNISWGPVPWVCVDPLVAHL